MRVFQVNIAERNIDFILAGEDESVRERIKMQLAEQRKSVSYRSDVPDQKRQEVKRAARINLPNAVRAALAAINI